MLIELAKQKKASEFEDVLQKKLCEKIKQKIEAKKHEIYSKI